MAYYTTQSTGSFASRSLRQRAANLFTSLQQGLVANQEFQRLNALSDTQLSKRGLTRQDLAAHVIDKGVLRKWGLT